MEEMYIIINIYHLFTNVKWNKKITKECSNQPIECELNCMHRYIKKLDGYSSVHHIVPNFSSKNW